MSGEPENLILRALARIREQNDLILSKLEELTVRVSSVDRELADLKRDFAGVKIDMAAINQRLDNFDRRLVRIERRLDLVDAPSA
jgi:hypothetical protein